MVVVYNEVQKLFVVDSFREFGDNETLEIPRNGFVLSGSGFPFTFYFSNHNKYEEGDVLNFVSNEQISNVTEFEWTYHRINT